MISQTNSHHLRFFSKIPKNELFHLRKIIGIEEPDTRQLSDTKQSSDSECETDHTSNYPPCIRAILMESEIKNFDLGSLFLIPYTGGYVGSGHELARYVLHFPNVEKIDKVHASIRYEKKKNIFLIKGIEY